LLLQHSKIPLSVSRDTDPDGVCFGPVDSAIGERRGERPTGSRSADAIRIGVGGASVDSEGAPLGVGRSKESRRRRWARKSRWLKGERAGYIYIGQYYRSWSGTQGYTMGFCQSSWSVYRKGEDRQLRSHGCKERVWCPGCCVYHRDTLAKEAAETVLLGIEALEICEGLRTSHYGLKVVTTMPKETSAWMDGSADRVVLLNGLFHAKQSFLKKWLGKGAGGVTGLDFTGESNPVEAHYHANSYIFPGRLTKAGWVEVPKWVDAKKGLPKLRKLWAQELRAHLGEDAPGLVGLEEADIWVNYLPGAGQVNHFLRYLYRSPLYDLWKGWQSGCVEDGVGYQVWKGGKVKEIKLSAESVGWALGRVADLPAKFKRVRWFGCFSDGQRKSTMQSLGLVAHDVGRGEGEELAVIELRIAELAEQVPVLLQGVEDAQAAVISAQQAGDVVVEAEAEEQLAEVVSELETVKAEELALLVELVRLEEWVLESGPYHLVRYRKAGEGGGLLLRHRDTGEVYKSEDLVGELGVVNYAPEGVLTGKRKRWRRPGDSPI